MQRTLLHFFGVHFWHQSESPSTLALEDEELELELEDDPAALSRRRFQRARRLSNARAKRAAWFCQSSDKLASGMLRVKWSARLDITELVSPRSGGGCDQFLFPKYPRRHSLSATCKRSREAMVALHVLDGSTSAKTVSTISGRL